MDNRLPHKDLQGLIRNNMGSQEHSFNSIYMIYTTLMNRDHFVSKYKPMSAQSLRQRLREWADVDRGWLVMKGDRKSAVYSVRPEEAECKMSHLHAKAMKLLDWSKNHSWLR